MKKIKFLSVLLMMLLANFAFVSCGSDDDGETGGADSGAPYIGVWKATHMEIIEDGESYGGSLPAGYTMELTLNADGTYRYYYYSPGEDGDDAEETLENGTWSFDKEESKIYCELIDDGDNWSYSLMGETTVVSWTATKLITQFREEDGYFQKTTWVRK